MRALLSVMVLGLAVLGCGSAENADGADAVTDDGMGDEISDGGILGLWEVIEVTSGTDFSNTGTTYLFRPDGTMQAGSGSLSMDGTWSVAGDTLIEVLGGVEMKVLISIDDNSMIFDIIGGEQTFLLERR